MIESRRHKKLKKKTLFSFNFSSNETRGEKSLIKRRFDIYNNRQNYIKAFICTRSRPSNLSFFFNRLQHALYNCARFTTTIYNSSCSNCNRPYKEPGANPNNLGTEKGQILLNYASLYLN
jgi:hypothetical protein